jgi:two-component system sensor histidine kinase CpxA
MKTGFKFRLHIKIFLSCLAILIAVEFAIFFLFKPIAVRHMNDKVYDYVDHRSQTFMDFLEEKMSLHASENAVDTRFHQEIIEDLAKIWRAKVWITSDEGEMLLRSFEGPVPVIPERELRPHGTVRIIREEELLKHGVQGSLFSRGFFQLPGTGTGFCNVLFDTVDRGVVGEAATIVQWTFVLFLVGIPLGVSLILFPVSLFISKPLNSLHRSVSEIAEGDFSHRAEVTTRDEIGELGTAFNHMAATIERMLSSMQELITNISHELRTPLSRIRIALEILGEKLRKADRIDFQSQLDSVHEDIEDIDRLVDKILQLSKIDLEKAASAKEDVDMSEVVRTLLEKFSDPIQRKSIDLNSDVEPGLVLNQTREEDIRAAFSNLLDNAVRYTSEAGRIVLKVKRTSRRIEATIENTCEPFSDEELRRLFDPFYRRNPSEGSGTGLGLAITRKILEKAGGHIEAERWNHDGLRIRVLFSY